MNTEPYHLEKKMEKRLKLFFLFFVETLFVVLGQQSENELSCKYFQFISKSFPNKRYFIIFRRVTLIGSRFLPVDLNYKAFLSRVNLSPNTIVNITLASGEYEKVKTFNTNDENNFDSVEFTVSSF